MIASKSITVAMRPIVAPTAPCLARPACMSWPGAVVAAAPRHRSNTVATPLERCSSRHCSCSASFAVGPTSPHASSRPIQQQQQQLNPSHDTSSSAASSASQQHDHLGANTHQLRGESATLQARFRRRNQQAQQQQPQRRASGPASPPLATISRLLLTGPNTNYVRSALAQRRGAGGGPISLLLFLLTVVAAAVAAVRSAIVRKVKGCRSCRGYGVERCRLCDGEGRVDWSAKLSHFDCCPLCMNRRYVVCTDCGGMYHRPLFSHMRRRTGDVQEEFTGVTVLEGAGAAGFTLDGPVPSGRND